MKFGKHLLSVVEEVHPEWAGAFLSYKELKKILGRLEKSSSSSQGADAEGAEDGAAGAGGQTSSEAGLTTLEEDFVRELVAQVDKMDKFFVDKEEDYIILLGHLYARAKALDPEDSAAYVEVERALVELHAELVLLENYSLLNYLALVKILKKHDKLTGIKLQERFLTKVKSQPFWSTRQLQRLIARVRETVETLQANLSVGSRAKPELLSLPELPAEPVEEDAGGEKPADRATEDCEAGVVEAGGGVGAGSMLQAGGAGEEEDASDLVTTAVPASTTQRFMSALQAWQRQGFKGTSFNMRQSLTPSPAPPVEGKDSVAGIPLPAAKRLKIDAES